MDSLTEPLAAVGEAPPQIPCRLVSSSTTPPPPPPPPPTPPLPPSLPPEQQEGPQLVGQTAANDHPPVADGEAAQHLRRLAKKDCTTKLKAVTALARLFKERPGAELVLLLPAWVFEYRRLAKDGSRQVREAANKAMGVLAVAVGRALAPHLRAAMGVWWASTFDPAAEVAAAASGAFQAAFPSSAKRAEALAFCGSNILQHVDEALRLTPQMAAAGKSIPPEEAFEEYERVVSTALLVLGELLATLLKQREGDNSAATPGAPGDEEGGNTTDKIVAEATDLLRRHSWLKDTSRSKSAAVRSSTNQALRNVLAHLPRSAVDEGGGLLEVAALAVTALGDRDPRCLVAAWDLLLLVSSRFPQIWEHAVIAKQLQDKLLTLLASAFRGAGSKLYPGLVPLLSLLPQAQLLNPKFLGSFFAALWEGRAACRGAAEWGPLLVALHECLLFVTVQSSRTQGSGPVLAEGVVKQVLVDKCWNSLVVDDSGGVADVPDRLSSSRVSSAGPRTAAPMSSRWSTDLRSCMAETTAALVLQQPEAARAAWAAISAACVEGALANRDREAEEVGAVLKQLAAKGGNVARWALHEVACQTAATLLTALPQASKAGARLLTHLVVAIGPQCLLSPVGHEGLAHGAEQPQYQTASAQHFVASVLVPWCLTAAEETMPSSLDLLIAVLVRQQGFGVAGLEVWPSVLEQLGFFDAGGPGDAKLALLATLLERLLAEALAWQPGKADVVQLDAGGRAAALAIMLRGNGSGPLLSPEGEASVLEVLLPQVQEGLQKLLLFDGKAVQTKELLSDYAAEEQGLVALVEARAALEAAAPSLRHWGSATSLKLRLLAAAFHLRWLARGLRHGHNDANDKQDIDAEDGRDYWHDTKIPIEAAEEHVDEAIVDDTGWEAEDESEELDDEGGNNGEAEDEPEEGGLQVDGESERDAEPKVRSASVQLVLAAVALVEDRELWGAAIPEEQRVELVTLLAQVLRKEVLVESWEDFHSEAAVWGAQAVEIASLVSRSQAEKASALGAMLAPEPSAGWPSWSSTASSLSSLSLVEETPPSSAHRRMVAFAAGVCAADDGLQLLLMVLDDEDSASTEKVVAASGSSGEWIVEELLCTWAWPEIGAANALIQALASLAQKRSSALDLLLANLFLGVRMVSSTQQQASERSQRHMCALLALLQALLSYGSAAWGPKRAQRFVAAHLGGSVLPPDRLAELLELLMPAACGAPLEEEDGVTEAVIAWLRTAHDAPPLIACSPAGAAPSGKSQGLWQQSLRQQQSIVRPVFAEAESEAWLRVAAACFPTPIEAAVEVPEHVAELLAALWRRQWSSREATAAVAAAAVAARQAPQAPQGSSHDDQDAKWQARADTSLAQLACAVVTRAAPALERGDWAYLLARLRRWLDAAVLRVEEQTEVLAAAASCGGQLAEACGAPIEVVRLSSAAVCLVSTLQGLACPTAAEGDLWSASLRRAEESVQRIFLALVLGASLLREPSELRSLLQGWATLWDAAGEVAARVSDELLAAAVRAADLWKVADGAATAAGGLLRLLTSQLSTPRLKCFTMALLLKQPLLAQVLPGMRGGPGINVDDANDDDEDEAADFGDGQGDLAEGRPAVVREEVLALLALPPARQLSSSHSMAQWLLAWALLLERLRTAAAGSTADRLVRLVQGEGRASLAALLETLCAPSLRLLPLVKPESAAQRRRGSTAAQGQLLPPWAAEAAAAAAEGARRGSPAFAVSAATEGRVALAPLGRGWTRRLACAVFGAALVRLPAAVRTWFLDLRSRSLQAALERFTEAHCSPHLLAAELAVVSADDETLSIRANRGAREVVARYRRDEVALEMAVRLAASHPLRPPAVECLGRAGVSEARLRKWLLGISTFLRQSNGSVAGAVALWRDSCEREFAGVEECPICYAVLHPSSHALPRLACRTCRNKFHAACLYKWFSSSHKSTCPLCQTPF
eukprot:SM000208S06310  [mRNA]  locus=s208:55234:63272:- [translate_table: standard]